MFMSAMVKTFSCSHSTKATGVWNGKFHLSPNENIFIIARMKTFIIVNVRWCKCNVLLGFYFQIMTNATLHRLSIYLIVVTMQHVSTQIQVMIVSVMMDLFTMAPDVIVSTSILGIPQKLCVHVPFTDS